MSGGAKSIAKFFSSVGDKMESAVTKTAKFIKEGPSVSDRVNMMKQRERSEGESDATAAEVRLEDCRVSVSCPSGAQDADTVTFQISLMDKRTNEQLHSVARQWPQVSQVVGMVRSTFTKLEVSPPPVPSHMAVVTIEDRRKYIQTFLNACSSYGGSAAKMKEVVELCGLKDIMRKHSDANASFSSPPNMSNMSLRERPSPQVELPTMAQSFAGSPSASPQTTSRPTARQSLATKVNEDPQTIALMDEIFRMVDVDNSGYVVREELEEYLENCPKQASPKVLGDIFDIADRDNTGALDTTMFRLVVTHLAQALAMTVQETLSMFRKVTHEQIYNAIGAEGESSSFDAWELQCFCHVIKVSGMKSNVSDDDVKGTDFSLRYSMSDFSDVVDALTAMVPLDEIVKSLSKSQQRNKLLQCITKHAQRAKSSHIRKLKDKMKLGQPQTATIDGKCIACDKVQQEMAAMQAKMAALEKKNSDFEAEVAELTSKLSVREDQVNELTEQLADKETNALELKDKIVALMDELDASKKTEAELLDRVCEVEAELDIEREKGSAWTSNSEDETLHHEDEEDLSTRCNLYFLNPAHLGSHEQAPVVDKPGALVYTLQDNFEPMGLVMDVFLTRRTGCEYFACRDAKDQRSLTWRIEDGTIICPGVGAAPVSLRIGHWVRVSVRIRWYDHNYDVLMDDDVVLEGVPFRDGDGVGPIRTVDVYPRNDVLICYANMHFFR